MDVGDLFEGNNGDPRVHVVGESRWDGTIGECAIGLGVACERVVGKQACDGVLYELTPTSRNEFKTFKFWGPSEAKVVLGEIRCS